MSLVIFQNNFYMMLLKLLPFRKEGAKESIDNVINYRDNFENIPVEGDQDVPEPRHSNLSMNFDLFSP